MTESSAKAKATDDSGSVGKSVLILLGMTVVAVALAVGLNRHLALPPLGAALVALLLFVCALQGHLALLRERRISALENELDVFRNLSRNRAGAEDDNADSGSANRAPRAGIEDAIGRALAGSEVTGPDETGPDETGLDETGGEAQSLRPATAPEARIDLAIRRTPESAGAANSSGHRAGGMSGATSTSRHVPAEEIYPGEHDGPATVASAGPEPTDTRALNESTIRNFVRNLSTDGQPGPAEPQSKPPALPGAQATTAPGMPGTAQQPPALPHERGAEVTRTGELEHATPDETDAVITQSVRALRATAVDMHAEAATGQEAADEMAHDMAPEAADETAGAAPMQQEPADDESHARLAVLAEALQSERIDMMLEPILSLEEKAPRHFEISLRLRTEEGERVDPLDEVDTLRGTGILPLIDIARISRVAEFARLLADRGKDGSVFTALASESLDDDDVVNRMAQIYYEREALAQQLVVSLSQEDLRTITPAQFEMIEDMRDLGFRFALDHLTDMDMGFEAMHAAGIEFVKLDAEVFLNGLPTEAGSVVPCEDVCRYLAEVGLTLIIGDIADENQLARILGFGVLFGQGRLFGGARPIKPQVFAPSRSAAA